MQEPRSTLPFDHCGVVLTALITLGTFLVISAILLTISLSLLAMIDRILKSSQVPATYKQYHRMIVSAKHWSIPCCLVSAVHILAYFHYRQSYLAFLLALVLFNALLGIVVRTATNEMFKRYVTVAMGNPFALTHQWLILAVAGIDTVTDWQELCQGRPLHR